MTFSVKSNLLKTINETNDPAMRTVLMLMLGVLEEVAEKIDSVVSNERVIKRIVLNGHTEVHHEHHEWVEQQMLQDKETQELLDWVGRKRADEAKAAERADETRFKVTQAVVVEAVKYLVFGGGCAAIAAFIATQARG